MKRASLSVWLLCVSTLAPTRTAIAFVCPSASSSSSSSAKTAKALFEEAVEIEASDPEGSLARYQCAAQLSDRPAIELRIGVVAERLHHDDIAIVAFERYLELAGSNAPDAASMRHHIRELRAKKQVTASAPPPSNAEKSGSSSGDKKTDSDAASTTTPTPTTTTMPTPQTTTYLGWGLLGAGAVLAVVGGGFLFAAKSMSDDVHSLPAGTRWSDEARSAYDKATRSQTIGVVLSVTGVAALVVGGVLLLTRSSSGSANAASAATTTTTTAGHTGITNWPFAISY